MRYRKIGWVLRRPCWNRLKDFSELRGSASSPDVIYTSRSLPNCRVTIHGSDSSSRLRLHSPMNSGQSSSLKLNLSNRSSVPSTLIPDSHRSRRGGLKINTLRHCRGRTILMRQNVAAGCLNFVKSHFAILDSGDA
jgi:hypothetical protein